MIPTDSTDAVLESPISIPEVETIQIPVSNSFDCEAYRNIISRYDWDVNTALAVCAAESHGDATVVNWKDNHKVCMGSAGLFQIGCVNAPIEDMKDPAQNIEKAYKLYQERGWKPWGAYTNGSYKKYLK